MAPSVLWLRRDLRLRDHPALLAAAESAGRDGVAALFVVDPALWDPAGPSRRTWLVRSLAALDDALGGRLVVRHGDPVDVVPEVATQVRADTVHLSADAGPYGRRRDADVEKALAGADVRLVRTGTPYAVGPGTLTTGAGEPFKVFTPFFRAWEKHGWPTPAPAPGRVPWLDLDGDKLPQADPEGVELPAVGEEAALKRWRDFLEGPLADYDEQRDLPALDATSGMSAHLKYGEVHPRTLLADLARRRSSGANSFRSELAWREFYADVLWHRPDSARDYLRPEYGHLRYDEPRRSAKARDRLAAWQEGRTGYPFVDAGMRQLRAIGWVHNRVRMVVASFLVKDLHLEWQHGARFFMHWLRDGDLASNNHGWQWTAGSGTDAAPYFRVFNPVTQGEKFDPDGAYVRRWVPELEHLEGKAAHTPWDQADGYAHGYPERIVDHAAERAEALARFEALRGR